MKTEVFNVGMIYCFLGISERTLADSGFAINTDYNVTFR